MLTPQCKDLFYFEPDTAYLDHGGFGVTPKEVLEYSQALRIRIEKSPRAYLDMDDRPLWKEVAASVARRFSAKPGDVALVENVTEGVNAVLHSLLFGPGDEIAINSMTYGAVANAARIVAERRGARVVKASFRYPAPGAAQCLESFEASLSSRTKLAIVDHIASAPGLIMPVAEMVKLCRARGIPVLVDGAHAPGHVPLNIESIKADWYVGNLHKWYMAPRSCGFLWAAKERQQNLIPAILGWESDKAFPASFEWTGTRDRSAWSSIPAAFAFMDRFGEENVRRHNHALIRKGIDILTDAWGVRFETPDSMTGSMAMLPLPDSLATLPESQRYVVQNKLWNTYRVSCPVIPFAGRLYIRVTAHIYNNEEDYEKLAHAVCVLAKTTTPSLVPA